MASRAGVYRAAGRARGKYAASQQKMRGFEYQKAGQAQADQFNLEKMYETTNTIAEAIGLASAAYGGFQDKKDLGKAVEGMGATEKKQGFGDWLFGAEKEYTMMGEGGKEVTLGASALKSSWGVKQAASVGAAPASTLAQDVGLSGGANKPITGSNVSNKSKPDQPPGTKKPDAKKKLYDPNIDYKSTLGTKDNPYKGKYGTAFGHAKEQYGMGGKFWWEDEEKGLGEYIVK